jgi:hypothetical protein
MAVKADWHEAAAASGPDDPFALASSIGMGHSPLTVDMSSEALGDRLKSLLKREKFLFDMGIECPIKDRCDTSCLACPLNEANDPDSPKGGLCRVGVEQEQCETLFAIKIDPDHAPTAAPSEPALKW